MVQVSALLALAGTFTLSFAAPLKLNKRIAQVISESTADWVEACLAAGGADQCNTISQTAFSTLLAAGGNCDQQDAADEMVSLAKSLGNDPEMIRLAQLFVQQPRNAPDSLQVPYCQVAPQNVELDGLFHCQFAGSDFTQFSGDQTGNLPLGVNAVNPPGSCPAKTDGPVPDGIQLNTLVSDPGVGVASDAGSATDNADASAEPEEEPEIGLNNAGDVAVGADSNTAVTPVASASGFQQQNGLDAIALNDQFVGLTASSPCTDEEQACVEGGFAQCVGGTFSITQCAGGTQCFALPLVNSPGTSITCTSEADKNARIAASGAA